ncbi:MAG: ABC transporter substrate-binding protein [bacterium]|nr:ABC transporter substrate-binding protein [bacterium]
MTKNAKIIIGAIIAIIAVGGIWYGAGQKPAPTETAKEPIKIGAILPLTGDFAFLGEGIRDAILLAKENLKDTQYNYEVIFEDDQSSDLKEVASAANKLINIDKVNILISVNSGPGNVVAPIAEQNKIIHFAIGSDKNMAKGDYNFIHWTQPSEEIQVFIAELQKRGIKKLGIFELNQQGATAMIDELQERLKETDIKIVSHQNFNFGEKDFRTIIAKAKQANAEIYLLGLIFPPELEILAKQIKEAGINIPITSIESFELTDQLSLFEGEWYVNAADPTEDFVDKFNKKIGKNPSIGAANGYDIFNLIVAASEKKESSIKPATNIIASELKKIKDFNGALGNLSVDEEGIVISQAVVRMIKDGKPITIDD